MMMVVGVAELENMVGIGMRPFEYENGCY